MDRLATTAHCNDASHNACASSEFVTDAHTTPMESTLTALGVSPATGLSAGEAEKRALSHGRNIIAVHGKASAFRILLHQFVSPVVYLLGAAAVLAMSFSQWKEAGAILVVLAINTTIGFITELRAARSIEALRSLESHTARVRRGGRVLIVPAETLVPGDILLVEAGDRISADLRLTEASSLAVDESTLTGEAVAAEKSTDAVGANASLGDRTCMLYKGTVVTRGSGVGVVVGTGLSTELGHISRQVLEAGTGRSPLEKRLARLSFQLVWIVLLLAVLIAAAGILSGKEPFLMVEAAIALAVATIPEGLPIVATLALARGMWRMARRNALVERLSAVETLGATTLILTDKTGTLTENRMTVRKLVLPSGEIALSADCLDEDDSDGVQNAVQQEADQLLQKAVLCNDATLAERSGESSGDPMELALLRAGQAVGMTRDHLIAAYPLLATRPFDSNARMMATLHADEGTAFWVVKGAPETVLAQSSRVVSAKSSVEMTEALRAEWLRKVDRLGAQGLRVLAFASRAADRLDDQPFRDLVLLGLAGLEDPPRADVPDAIAACKEAGIHVVMVTGDHAGTARSIGLAVGLHQTSDGVVEGGDLERLRNGDGNGIEGVTIFARVSPAEKLALVRAYQEAGEVVAMTGDGVNDAPALKQADIGVAMGHSGTDVAREAAAMVLLDDAFPTIVRAIQEGRIIFENIRRFVAYLLSCNLSEVLVVGLAVLVTLPLPILPLQILYLNLVTDVFPAFALAMGEGEHDILKRPPRAPGEPILTRRHWARIVAHGVLLTGTTFTALAVARLALGLDAEATITVTFLTLAFSQLWHVFNMHERDSGIFRNEVTRNPWVWIALGMCIVLLVAPIYVPDVAGVLGLVQPTTTMWFTVGVCSVLPLVIGDLAQALINRDRPA